MTIDGDDAKDFDDAVYCEPHPQGFRVIVAIADVSYYVRRGTALDASARERGTSVYFPTTVIPMLPFALSNVLCSLQPRVDRLCFAADMVVSRQGVLLDAHFYPAVMRSAFRLTYTKAFAALFEAQPEARAELGRCTTNYCRWSRCTAPCSRRVTSAARSSSMPPRPSSISMPPGVSSACTSTSATRRTS